MKKAASPASGRKARELRKAGRVLQKTILPGFCFALSTYFGNSALYKRPIVRS